MATRKKTTTRKRTTVRKKTTSRKKTTARKKATATTVTKLKRENASLKAKISRIKKAAK